MSLLYENGYAFTDPLPEWLDFQKTEILGNREACLILVDGALGKGKSTMAMQIARFFDEDIEPNEESYRIRYYLGGKDFLQGALKSHKAGAKVLVFDESGIDMSSRRAMSSMNMNLLGFFQMYRYLGIPVILVLPNIGIIDKQIFDYGIHRFTVHMDEKINGKYAHFRVYDQDSTMFVHSKIKQYIVPRHAYRSTSVTPNFLGWVKPLPPEHQKVLDKLGSESKDKRIGQLAGVEGYTMSEVSGKLGVTDAIAIRRAKKIGIQMFKNPEDKRQKMITKEDYERLRTLEFDGVETI